MPRTERYPLVPSAFAAVFPVDMPFVAYDKEKEMPTAPPTAYRPNHSDVTAAVARYQSSGGAAMSANEAITKLLRFDWLSNQKPGNAAWAAFRASHGESGFGAKFEEDDARRHDLKYAEAKNSTWSKWGF